MTTQYDPEQRVWCSPLSVFCFLYKVMREVCANGNGAVDSDGAVSGSSVNKAELEKVQDGYVVHLDIYINRVSDVWLWIHTLFILYTEL